MCQVWSSEESINHAFFECLPALQVWALSKIPSNLYIFPRKSLFTNMNHLFSRVLPQMEDHQFAWILWYIWKDRNNKVFSNLDIDPMDTLRLSETKSTLWAEAQILDEQRIVSQVVVTSLPPIPGRWCFTDGSWKEGDIFSGQGWFSTLEGFDGLLGRGMFGLAYLFMRIWKRYYGQWNVWKTYVNFRLRLQRIVFNWWK